MEKQFKNITNLTSNPSSGTPKSQVQRIREIQQKLQHIAETKSAQQRQQKTNNLVTRISNMEKSTADLFWKLQTQLKEQRQFLKEMNREFQENRSQQDLALRNRVSEINQIQAKVTNIWKMEMQKVKEAEKKAIVLYEEKIETIRLQILKQVQQRKLYFATLDEKLSDKLPSLQLEISEKMQVSAQNLMAFQKQISEETETVCKNIKDAQVKQLTSFQELMRMMSSVIAEIKQEIAEQKQSRLASKKKLLFLFQGAYSRLSN